VEAVPTFSAMQGSGLSASGTRFRAPGFQVEGSGFGALGLEFWVLGSGFRVQGAGFRVSRSSGMRVSGIRVWSEDSAHVGAIGLALVPSIR